MKKTLLAIAAILLTTSAMAQNGAEKRDVFSPACGISYQFIEHGGSVDLDLAYMDAYIGWYNYDGVKANDYAFCATHPYTLNLGRFFFIRPTVGLGYIHLETRESDSVDRIYHKLDFLLFPKAGIQIPLGEASLTIFASYRYDAPSFRFESKEQGSWGAGLGINF